MIKIEKIRIDYGFEFSDAGQEIVKVAEVRHCDEPFLKFEEAPYISQSNAADLWPILKTFAETGRLPAPETQP